MPLSLGTGSVDEVSLSSTRIAAQSRFQVAPGFSPCFPTPQTYKVDETLRRVRLTTQPNPAGHSFMQPTPFRSTVYIRNPPLIEPLIFYVFFLISFLVRHFSFVVGYVCFGSATCFHLRHINWLVFRGVLFFFLLLSDAAVSLRVILWSYIFYAVRHLWLSRAFQICTRVFCVYFVEAVRHKFWLLLRLSRTFFFRSV